MKLRLATMSLMTLALAALCAPGMMTSDPAAEASQYADGASKGRGAFYAGPRKGRRYYFGAARSAFARHQNDPHKDRYGRLYNRAREESRRQWQTSYDRSRQDERDDAYAYTLKGEGQERPRYLPFRRSPSPEARQIVEFNADQARALADIRRTDELTADAGLS